MKKTLSLILGLTLFATSIFSLSACSQLDVAEQPDPVVIYAEKIYPSAVGNCLTDASVNVPAIDAYMEEYNKNADASAVINYDTIKYNKDADYYYVNDNSTAVGMKFRLDSTKSIISASIYTGTLDQTTKNVYNVVINAIQTSGYKSLMTEEDKAIIQKTVNGIQSVEASKNHVQQIFNGQENFAAKWQNNLAEFEIPIKPTEMPKPDTSHTLESLKMPTVEVPKIDIDTSLVEGKHLSDGTTVTKKDVDDIVNKINAANAQIAATKEYNKTIPSDVNETMAALISANAKKETMSNLMQASAQLSQLTASPQTQNLPSVMDLSASLNESFKAFEAATNYITCPHGCGTQYARDVKHCGKCNKEISYVPDISDKKLTISDLEAQFTPKKEDKEWENKANAFTNGINAIKANQTATLIDLEDMKNDAATEKEQVKKEQKMRNIKNGVNTLLGLTAMLLI